MERTVSKLLLKIPSLGLKGNRHRLEILTGSTVAFLLRSLDAGLSFGYTVALAKILGAQGADLYFLAASVTAVTSLFGRLGLDNPLLRFTASNASVGDWKAVRGLYRAGIRLALGASGVCAFLMYLLAPLLAERLFHKPELLVPLRWMSLAVVPMTLVSLHAQLLRGLRRIKDSLLVGGLSVSLLLLVGFPLMGIPWGLRGMVWAFLAANILATAWGIRLWFSTPHLKGKPGNFPLKRILDSCIPIFWVSLLTMIINRVSTFALGIYGHQGEVAIYETANRTASLVTLVLLSVNSISAPKFAAFFRKKQMAHLETYAKEATLLMTLCAAPVLLLLLLFPGFFMGLFGPEFKAGGTILAVLSLGQFVNVATGAVAFLLTMSGHEALARDRTFFVALLALALNFLLVPRFGAMGAAISTTLCLVITNLISTVLVRAKLGIWIFPFSGKKR